MTRLRQVVGFCPCLFACGQDAATPAADVAVVTPGRGIGSITLGQTWASVRDMLGAPTPEPTVLVRIGVVTWPERGLEALLTSPADDRLTDDAVVIGVGAHHHASLNGIAVEDLDRSDVEASFGAAPEEYAGHAYYPVGLALEYGDDEQADKIAVVSGYLLAPEPPPMVPAAGAFP